MSEAEIRVTQFFSEIPADGARCLSPENTMGV